MTRKKFNDELPELLRSAENGNIVEQSQLAVEYFDGTYLRTNYGKMHRWLSEASKLNHAQSQYMLGLCYYNGIGIAEDKDKAFEMFF